MGETAISRPHRREDPFWSLIARVEEKSHGEGFQYVPRQVLEAWNLTVETEGHHAKKPTGMRWNNDEELTARYPRLAVRFG